MSGAPFQERPDFAAAAAGSIPWALTVWEMCGDASPCMPMILSREI